MLNSKTGFGIDKNFNCESSNGVKEDFEKDANTSSWKDLYNIGTLSKTSLKQ